MTTNDHDERGQSRGPDRGPGRTDQEDGMKKLLLTTIAGTMVLFAWSVPGDAEVVSLRGQNPIDAVAKEFDRRRQVTKDRGFQRTWKLQPPLIPHKIDKDEITLSVNTCMRCHSPENYKKEAAPKVADSHFIAADGTKSETLNMRRHFCNQCHVPQLDAQPIVENVFDSSQ